MSSSDASRNSAETGDLLNWSLLSDASVMERCRTSLRDDGAMILRNVATQDSLNRLKAEVQSCPYNDSKQHYTPWQDQGDYVNHPPSHPRNFKMHSSASFVGRKSLEQTGEKLAMSMYADDRLVHFLSKVADTHLYRSTDDNGSVYSYRVNETHSPPWHFDEAPYTAILYLQNSEGGGGEFEYVPWSRPTLSKDDKQGHQVVESILMKNKREGIQQIEPEPGTLLLFSGAHSFHRVAPTTGTTPRLGLVFTFGLKKGFTNSDSVKKSNEWDPVDATCLVQGDAKGETSQ
mmetsp:Transcript_10534/g.16176  ORF Transcript_10534/g.16176 Transcript_10534/m.16176 type:complete len:289 (+) Transcript_10534:75-941(+)